MPSPLAIDLFCGLGGWSAGLLAEGWDVVGFDIERHEYGGHRYPAQLVLQDILTLHGSQFREADLIVASPPCQEFSYMAMPWKLAKAKAAAIRADTSGRMLADLTRLFDACFRIQAQASVAAGRHIPLIIENVRGAQPWVGRSRWAFGSYHLWGDVPALMPITVGRPAFKGGDRNLARAEGGHQWNTEFKVPGFRFDGSGCSFQSESVDRYTKNSDGSWFAVAHNTTSGKGQNPDGREGIKNGNDWFGAGDDCSLQRRQSSRSNSRKAASAMIAKIPLPLARHIAAVYRP